MHPARLPSWDGTADGFAIDCQDDAAAFWYLCGLLLLLKELAEQLCRVGQTCLG